MKQFKLVVMSICSVLMLWILFSGPADARASVQGNVVNDGQDYVGRIVVITDARPSTVISCGDSLNKYRAVIISPGGGPTINTFIGISQLLEIEAGDRFDVSAQTPCNGQLDLEMTPK